MPKKVKERDSLRLVQWYYDRFPPIDLNNHHSHVIDLINEILRLRKELYATKKI